MPCFKSDYTIELNETLQAMGMCEAFKGNADFSNLAETKSGNLYIGQVLQKTFIEVDENGTKAAAATSIMQADNCALVEEVKNVVLNRPFVYAIVDTETSLPVFIGVLNHIE
jgi:serpin B